MNLIYILRIVKDSPAGDERSKKVNEHERQLLIIEEAKPYKIFARYMKVKLQ